MTQNAVALSPKRPVSLQLDSAELAATYDEVSVRQFNHGKILIAELAPKSGERALDIGCGTGRLGAYVADLVAPHGEVLGIDPLPLRIDLAARKNPRFKASVGRAEDLSAFADASFDVAYANSVFHWVEDKAKALREARRVLKSGGRFGVNSANADRQHQSAALVREAVIEEGLEQAGAADTTGVNYRVNAAELERLLKEAGFQDIRVTPHTFVDEVSGADDLFAWSKSSSFGNF
ncbi:MAG TPA: methyltransferase domain-containing protein, partial [Polyangiaceae bacterium]